MIVKVCYPFKTPTISVLFYVLRERCRFLDFILEWQIVTYCARTYSENVYGSE